MPIWEPALTAAGLTPADVTTALHYILPPAARRELPPAPRAVRRRHPDPPPDHPERRLDRRRVPHRSVSRSSCSPRVVRSPQELDEADLAIIRERLAVAGAPTRPRRAGDPGAETGLSPALTAAVALERPLVLGSAGPGMSSPSLETFEGDARAAPAPPRRRARWPRDPERQPIAAPAMSAALAAAPTAVAIRQHPYVRLALNGSFSALWAGQLISLFGDRLNQLALVAVVAISTGSALATGLVFFAATLPNLLLSPIAGTFVDRWDHKEVMVVSDILRAAIVLILPVAAITNIVLVYPLIFLVTSISVFFRPARVAILPAHRPGAGPAQRELGAVGRRDDRRHHRLPAGGALRRPPRQCRPARLLGRQRDLPRVGGPDRLDGRAPTGPLRVRSWPRHDPASWPSSMRAGSSFGTRPSCWRTRSRARSGSSAWVCRSRSPRASSRRRSAAQGSRWQASYGFLETGIGIGNLIGGFAVGLDRGPVHEGPDGHPRLHAVGRPHPVVRVEQQPRRGDRAGVRPGRREHDLRDPEPDPLPGTHAAAR